MADSEKGMEEEEEFGMLMKSEEEKDSENEGINEDQMTLAQCFQSLQSLPDLETPNPLAMVVFDDKPETPFRSVSSLEQLASNKPKTPLSLSYEQKQALPNHGKAKLCTIERAEEVRANLDPRFPSFVKSMHPSHVYKGFWMGLPAEFCKAHLPKYDVQMTLIDENQEEFVTNYLWDKIGLSGGWKGFAVAHKLVERDTLVFQLIKATTFQVHIIRAFSLGAVDGVIGLLTPDSNPKHSSACKSMETTRKSTRKRRKTVSFDVVQAPRNEKFGSDSDEVASEVLEGIGILKTSVEFKDVRDMKSFTIAINGLVIDSELSKNERSKYYELCCSKDAFLHDNLLAGINMKLAAGAISETVSIADAITSSKLSTYRDDCETWDKSLKALEQLGMNVGFLRARIQKLLKIANESEGAVDLKQYSEAIVGQARVKEEIRSMKAKLVELEKTSKRMGNKIKTLKKKARRHELKFQTEVSSHW